MTVREFYDYCKKNNILDYDIEIRGEYFYDSVYFGDDKENIFMILFILEMIKIIQRLQR